MFPGLYSEERAAQAAAYMLSRAGNSIEILTLMKLMYLSERLFLQRFGLPISGDKPVSMELGPVLSYTYDCAKSYVEVPGRPWWKWMLPRSGNDIRLRTAIANPRGELKQLSDAAFGVLSEIWEKFGHIDGFELVEYLHRNCPEWKEPPKKVFGVGRTSIPIPPEELFQAIGFSADEDRERIAWLEATARINDKLRSL